MSELDAVAGAAAGTAPPAPAAAPADGIVMAGDDDRAAVDTNGGGGGGSDDTAGIVIIRSGDGGGKGKGNNKNSNDIFVGNDSGLREEKKESSLEPTSSSEDIIFGDPAAAAAGGGGGSSSPSFHAKGKDDTVSPTEEEDGGTTPPPHAPAGPAAGAAGGGGPSTPLAQQPSTPTVTPEGAEKGGSGGAGISGGTPNHHQKPMDLTVDTQNTTKSEISSSELVGASSSEQGGGAGVAMPTTPKQQNQPSSSSSRRRSYNDDDDDDSSNDESSYFADPRNLPSPKSGRHRFESESVNSMRDLTSNNYHRESDASLSLSEDSDDDRCNQQPMMPPPQLLQHQQQQLLLVHPQPQHPQQQQREGGVPELYPHPITRMHSVSSLVSTSSQNSSGDDQCLKNELRDVVLGHPQQILTCGGPAAGGHHSSASSTPDGRKSPVLGQHPLPHMLMMSPSNHGQPSPPTIWPMAGQDQQQAQAKGYPLQHPQPQHWNATSEEWAQWLAASQEGGGGAGVGYGFPPFPPTGSGESPPSKESSARSKDSTFTYSEDSEAAAGTPGRHSFFSSFSPGDKSAASASSAKQQQQLLHQSATMSNPGAGGGGSGEAGSRSKLSREGSSNLSRGSGIGGSGAGPGGFNASQQGSASESAKLLPGGSTKKKNGGGGDPPGDGEAGGGRRRGDFKVYWQRWIMLMYMSILNLLSDWTCYSVAPIAVLTEEAFGRINAEQLVVVFLGANGISTACEPILLSRLGLRRTVLFGALLLMMGSVIKSGGMPPIIQADLEKGQGEWRVYLGFFLVGLSQPLYQCTPALLSASWFPERERTMATGVALNANQVGIGFAFIFGTLLVETSDDIPGYFGLLSLISTITFLGTLIQFDDAPPTPPSDTARVMRGTLEVGLPSVHSIFQSVKNLGASTRNLGIIGNRGSSGARVSGGKSKSGKNRSSGTGKTSKSSSGGKKESSGRRSSRKDRRSAGASSSRRTNSGSGSTTRRRSNNAQAAGDSEQDFHGLGPTALAPSPAFYGSVSDHHTGTPTTFDALAFPAPSPMLPGPVGSNSGAASIPTDTEDSESQLVDDTPASSVAGEDESAYSQGDPTMNPYPGMAGYPFQPPLHGGFQAPPGGYPPQPQMGLPYGAGSAEGGAAGTPYGYGYGYGMPYQGGYAPPPYQQPVWDPRYQQYVYLAGPTPPQPVQQQPPPPYYMGYPNQPPPAHTRGYESVENVLPSPAEAVDVGAEPVLTMTAHHLDINIRDDQVLLSIRACLSRPGFIHALVAFTVSGIVINTLSTYMDYLVRLNGVGRAYTGIVGGSFQFGIMISSLIIGQFTDKTRAYYSVAVGMLVLGAFALAQCGVNLDSDRGVELRWSLIVVALLVGPLQPVSTELGVDVVYPLSENTVLVIQQLFSNLLSAGFIPIFKALKDIGLNGTNLEDTREKPEYTFSFYVLIVLHAAATVFFATFNGRYLRYEHELEKKAQEEAEDAADAAAAISNPSASTHSASYGSMSQQQQQQTGAGVYTYVNESGELVHTGHQGLLPPTV